MKKHGSELLRSSVILAFACMIFACGGDVELKPELEAHLDEYEDLIESFESKFADAREDQARFSDVADSYSVRVKAWVNELSTVAPNLSDEEARAVKSRVDRLNKRAERMLRGI